MWKMILVFVLVVLLESVASYEGNKPSAAPRASPPLLVASATSSDKDWSEIINACIRNHNYKTINGVMSIDTCKEHCVNEDRINCQSIEYRNTGTCVISGARSDSEDYLEPCPDRWEYAERLLNVDKIWSDIRNACIIDNDYRTFKRVTSIDACKEKCIKEDSIDCQSIEFHSHGRVSGTCVISKARSDSKDYKAPCFYNKYEYAERLLTADATPRVTTANEYYYWQPRDPEDTLWFTTNTTGTTLTLRYKGPNNNYIQFTPRDYKITENNVWHRIVYKAELDKKLTICPDHNFEKSITDPEIDTQISFKHSTGFVKWSTSIPDLKTAIQIGPGDIKNYTGEYNIGEGPEKLFGVSGKWRPTGLTKGYNNWSVTVDLREIYTITKISLKLQGNGRTDVKTFKLEVSNVWGPITEIFRVDTVITGVTETQGFPLPSGSSGRFCRFTVTETVTGEAPVIQDLSFYGFTECSPNSKEEESSTLVYSSTPQSTRECHKNKTINCQTPHGETEVCTTAYTEICSDTLVCKNVTTSVCRTISNNTKKCEDSTETKCKTSTKDFFDEDGCATLLTTNSVRSSSGLYTSIVFNILLVLVIAILAYLLYAQTGCICNKHNYRKQSLFFEPPTHSPTPPPIRNPVLERMAGIGLDNHASRQSEHLYDAPYEYRERMDMKVPEEVTIRENPTSNRGSTHDSVNSFYAAVN
ncbi:unnamed protein product [Meganyctiphanes norvegica]|uniref:Apple domain-containing protein n=1 Tax=Meganyctiphanes norvegica TaxID=48144 RepID=A0AAV2Q565_MEGNR